MIQIQENADTSKLISLFTEFMNFSKEGLQLQTFHIHTLRNLKLISICILSFFLLENLEAVCFLLLGINFCDVDHCHIEIL